MPSKQITHSPTIFSDWSWILISSRFPWICFSNSFEISFTKLACLCAPKCVISSSIHFKSLCGDSYITMVQGNCANQIYWVCLPFFWGRNPWKKNRSQGNPDETKAGTNAVAPGNACTSILCCRHSLTNKKAGSEIPGVPASVTMAMSTPDFSLSITLGVCWCSLLAWKLWNSFSTP